MNAIGLTGANPATLEAAAAVLLSIITDAGQPVTLFLHIEDVLQATALRRNTLGLTEIWRIGADTTRPDLDAARMVHETVDDSDPRGMRLQLYLNLCRFLTLVQQCRDIGAALDHHSRADSADNHLEISP